MQLLEITLPTVAENLALDEALLNEAEEGAAPDETLRIWEWTQTAVIVGRASQLEKEVNLLECEAANVPVMRRCSGGCAVVIGPGCLLFSVVLSYERRPELQVIDESHRYVLGCVQQAITLTGVQIELQGTSDLTWQGRKFSGNSLRCKRNHLLYHGTILYDFDLTKIDQLLLTPPREPSYRASRAHHEFVTNLPISREQLLSHLPAAFGVDAIRNALPERPLQQLMMEKYSQLSWHRER